MKLSDLAIEETQFTQLASTVLAVLIRSRVGWAVYVKGVAGHVHSLEWQDVLLTGDKQQEPVAVAIIQNLFHPGFEIDLPYET